ncbi:hypothetical protein CVT24_005950 [Panaeolus cyanescens]|uniref:Uncharacterized protein n=1 Tax=Panaeolus cyanescens TaxID=181874 RepID=A0A409VCV4_9AGAR|nr:hypothetical protein CVT24_005950 [Panaeolus cyanescens]
MSIPNPFKTKRPRTLADLHDAMKSTHPDDEQFSEFKNWIIFYHSSLKLVSSHVEQPPEIWQDFLSKIVALQPQLIQYTECWPVATYYDSYSKRQVYKQKQAHASKEKKKEGRMHSEHGGLSLTLPLANGRQSYTIPPRMTPNDYSGPVEGPTFTQKDYLPANASPSHDVVAANICDTCRLLRRNNLVEICKDRQLLTSLFRIGVTDDHHLQLLVALPHAQRQQFLTSISNEKMNANHKFQMLKALEPLQLAGLITSNQDSERPWLFSKFSSPISCPGDSVLLQYPLPEFKYRFRDAMGLAQYPNVFDHIYGMMEHRSAVYFDIPSPTLSQYTNSVLWLSRAFEPYDLRWHYRDFWPVRIYMTMKGSMFPTKPQFTEKDQSEACSSLFDKEVCNENNSGTSMVQVGQHSQPTSMDAATKNICNICSAFTATSVGLQARLSRFGLSAVLPVLAQMGLNCIYDFDDFCARNETERVEIMKLSGAGFSDLERFTLGPGLGFLLAKVHK